MNFSAVWRTYRKLLIGCLVLIALAAAISLIRRYFVDNTVSPATGDQRPATAVYTCPMHPQVREPKPGDCPICGMRLVPVETSSSVAGRRSPATADTEHRAPSTEHLPTGDSVFISPDRQQLIGVKTEIVERRPAVQEIRTVGRVAYDPDLLLAQKEFVTALRLGDRQLLASSELHLRHMGISEDELTRLRATRKVPTNLFLPKPGEPVWVYAPLYEHELPYIQPGATATISLPTGSATFTGTVRSISPVIDPKTRSAHARIEVPDGGGKLRPETYVNTQIQVWMGEHIVIPTSAIIDSGTRKVVVVQTAENQFAPREVTTGASLGDTYIIAAGLAEGERIVTSAAFLIDSESRLKAALQEGVPSVGHEGHQGH